MVDSSREDGPREGGAQVLSLVPWERTLFRARRGALLETEEAVAAATPLEAYLAIKRRGLEDALAVLGALSPEQIRVILDLEVWNRDAIDVAELLTWLEAFRTAGLAALARAARSLDPEALAAVLRRRLLVALVPKEDRSDPEPTPDWLVHPPEDIEPILATPDGRFYVAARAVDERADLAGEPEEVEEDERKQILALVRELYLDEEWEYVAGILRLTLEDLSSSLEEDAFRFRSARLEDLGFPPFEQALEVYGPLDPSALGAPPPISYGVLEDARLPLVHAEALSRGLLDAGLRGLDGPTATRVEADLLAVANAVLVADRVDAGDFEGISLALGRARAYIEIALAFEAEGETLEVLAARRLATVHPMVLHRVGYTLTIRLAARARTLLEHPGLGGLGLYAFSAVERGIVEALLLRRPLFGRALEPAVHDPYAPLDEALADAVRPFERPEDVQTVERFLLERERLAEGLLAIGLFDAEIAEPAIPGAREERDIDLRLATAGARALLGDGFRPDPLDEAMVLELLDRLGSEPPGAGPSGDLQRVVGIAGSGLPEPNASALARRLETVLVRLRASLFPLVGSDRVDLRFVEGLLRTPPPRPASPHPTA